MFSYLEQFQSYVFMLEISIVLTLIHDISPKKCKVVSYAFLSERGKVVVYVACWWVDIRVVLRGVMQSFYESGLPNPRTTFEVITQVCTLYKLTNNR